MANLVKTVTGNKETARQDRTDNTNSVRGEARDVSPRGVNLARVDIELIIRISVPAGNAISGLYLLTGDYGNAAVFRGSFHNPGFALKRISHRAANIKLSWGNLIFCRDSHGSSTICHFLR